MYKNYPYRHVSGAAPERQQVNRVHKQYEQQQQREAELAAPLGTGPAWHALWSSMHCEHAGRYGEQQSPLSPCNVLDVIKYCPTPACTAQDSLCTPAHGLQLWLPA